MASISPPFLTLPLCLTPNNLLLSVIPTSSRRQYLSYKPMDDYFFGLGTLTESPHAISTQKKISFLQSPSSSSSLSSSSSNIVYFKKHKKKQTLHRSSESIFDESNTYPDKNNTTNYSRHHHKNKNDNSNTDKSNTNTNINSGGNNAADDDEDKVSIEEKERAHIELLLRFIKLDKESKKMKQLDIKRELINELRKEIEKWLKEKVKEIESIKNELKQNIYYAQMKKKEKDKNISSQLKKIRRLNWMGFKNKTRFYIGQKFHVGNSGGSGVNAACDVDGVRDGRFNHGRNWNNVIQDKTCKQLGKQIKKLEKELKNLTIAKEECTKKLSYLATANPRINLQQRFDILEMLFSKHKPHPVMDHVVHTNHACYTKRSKSEDYFACDSPPSSSDFDTIHDQPQQYYDETDEEQEPNVFAQAARLLSQLDKLLRDTHVAATNFQLATEAFEAALWQLNRIPTARVFDPRCCDDHLYNSRIDTAKKYFARGKQYVVNALRFAGGAQLVLEAMPPHQFDELFSLERMSPDNDAGIRRSVYCMKVAVTEALGAVREASSDLSLFVRDAEHDRKELSKALIFEQERMVEYRTALIYEHVLRSGTLATRLYAEQHATRSDDSVANNNKKRPDKRISHRNVQLQSFDDW